MVCRSDSLKWWQNAQETNRFFQGISAASLGQPISVCCSAVAGNNGWLAKVFPFFFRTSHIKLDGNNLGKILNCFFLSLCRILISFYLIYLFISFFSKAATPRNLRKYNMIIQWYCILYMLPVLNSLFECLTSYLLCLLNALAEFQNSCTGYIFLSEKCS